VTKTFMTITLVPRTTARSPGPAARTPAPPRRAPATALLTPPCSRCPSALQPKLATLRP
jgi:hypothetical protein